MNHPFTIDSARRSAGSPPGGEERGLQSASRCHPGETRGLRSALRIWPPLRPSFQAIPANSGRGDSVSHSAFRIPRSAFKKITKRTHFENFDLPANIELRALFFMPPEKNEPILTQTSDHGNSAHGVIAPWRDHPDAAAGDYVRTSWDSYAYSKLQRCG
jgi:hypothetical protein